MAVKTLIGLYSRLTVAQHRKIYVIPEAGTVVYDTGTAILEAYMTPDGTLVPKNAATRDALAAL